MKNSSSAGKSGQPNVSNLSEHDKPPQDSNTSAIPSILPSPVTSKASSAAGVSRPSSAAAVAFQQASVTYHEAVMAKRLDIVQQMHASLIDTTTVAYQSAAAYSHYLEGLHFTHRTLAYSLQCFLLPEHVICAANSTAQVLLHMSPTWHVCSGTSLMQLFTNILSQLYLAYM